MAMIKCPECNGDISDKSTKCVHCGHVLNEEVKLVCEECGAEIKKGDEICSKCGCPVKKSEAEEPQKVVVTKVDIGKGISKKNILIAVGVVLIVIVGIFGGLAIKSGIDKKNAEEASATYKSDLMTLTLTMLSGSADAEECGNKIKKVWYNSIWKENDIETNKYTKNKYGTFNSDFNDSLNALFSDSQFEALVNKVKQNQKDVNSSMKKMKNPPEEWKDAYNDLKDYYDDYLTFTNMCVNPSGSLTTYSSNFSTADSNALNSYYKVKAYLDY